MSAITQLLDNLADGSQTLAEVAADFEEFDWETPSVTPDDAEEDSPPIEDSFDEVQADSRLTAKEYARLAKAYRTAVTEVNPDDIFTAASDQRKTVT